MHSSNVTTINADYKMYFLQFYETDAQNKENSQWKPSKNS